MRFGILRMDPQSHIICTLQRETDHWQDEWCELTPNLIKYSVFRLSLFYHVVPVKNHLPVNLPVNRPSGKFQRFTTLLVTVISLKYEIRVASHGPDHDDCHRDGEEIDVEPAERDPIERKKKIAATQQVGKNGSFNLLSHFLSNCCSISHLAGRTSQKFTKKYIMNEWTPHSVCWWTKMDCNLLSHFLSNSCCISHPAGRTSQKFTTKYHDWVDAPQCMSMGQNGEKRPGFIRLRFEVRQ